MAKLLRKHCCEGRIAHSWLCVRAKLPPSHHLGAGHLCSDLSSEELLQLPSTLPSFLPHHPRPVCVIGCRTALITSPMDPQVVQGRQSHFIFPEAAGKAEKSPSNSISSLPCCLVVQSRPALCDSMDCSLPGSSVCGILWPRTVELVAMPSSRGSSWPRSPALAGRFFITEPPGKPLSLSPQGLQIPRYVGFPGTGQGPVCSSDQPLESQHTLSKQAIGRFEMRWSGQPLRTREDQNKMDGCTVSQNTFLKNFPPYSLGSFFFFNWRIMALQFCVGLCHTSTWISHRHTHVPSLRKPLPSPLPTPPLSVVPGHWVELPASNS